MANLLQFKRNQTVAENKSSALSALQTYLRSASEGEPAIARYNEGGSVKILYGISNGDDNYTIFDNEAIPSDVQDKLDEITNSFEIINGNEETEGSIAKAEKDAKDYADSKVNALDYTDTAVAKKFVTEVSETDGVIAVKRGSITSTGNTITITNAADGGINLDVISSALTQYVGKEAINVSAESGGNKTISLKINSNDKVLTQSVDGLLANIDLTWSTSDGLKLIGKGGEAIAEIPATDFVKDGMLQNVELKTASSGQPIGGQTTGTFLVFTFNTDGGSKVINVNVTSLIDVYTAGNGISVTGKIIAAKLDGSTEKYLTVGADGIKLSGVQAAIGVETERAKAEETRITDTVIGEDQLEGGKSVMDVVLENEETTQQAIEKLATATGVLSGEEIKYTAPTVSGEFSSTTSIMDMLNKIDEKWNTIDCGTY